MTIRPNKKCEVVKCNKDIPDAMNILESNTSHYVVFYQPVLAYLF